MDNSAAQHSSWWNREGGGREVVAIALPLVVSTGSWTVMNFTDRMFLLWYSTTSVAAVLSAGMLYFTLICFPLGVAHYVNTFVAQYHGAQRPARIGPIVWQGVWMGVGTIPLLLLTIPWAPDIFAWAGHTPAMAAAETEYYRAAVLGAGGTVISAALSAFFTGRGETRVVMGVSIAAAALNVVLDYAWIFGNWGFAPLGIRGAALATSSAEWFRVAAYAVLMIRRADHGRYRLAEGWRLDRALFARLMRYGGPNGCEFVLEVAAFSVFLLILGRLGEVAMAATTLALNINSLAWVPMLGIAIAVSTLVGQRQGEGRPDLAARATWTSLWMSLAYTSVMAAFYIGLPGLFLIGYAAGASAEDFQRLREPTTVLLRFVAAYSLLDAAALIFVSAIKGAGDTRFTLIVHSLLSPPPAIACWVGIEYFGGGLYWCWWVLSVWIATLALVWMARFLGGAWRTMRVIEPEDTPIAGETLDELEYTGV